MVRNSTNNSSLPDISQTSQVNVGQAKTEMSNIQNDIQENKPNRKLLFGIFSFTTILACLCLIYFLLIWPNVLLKEYIGATSLITNELSSEISQIESSGFINLGITVKSREEGLKSPDAHLEKIKFTKNTISALQYNYKQIKVPDKGKDVDLKLTKCFLIAFSFLDKYQNRAQMNKDINRAFGTTFLDEQESFATNYYRGGDRVNFIIQSQKIADLASDAVHRMKLLNPLVDNKNLYNLQLQHLEDMETTFTRLEEIYRTSRLESIDNEINSITQKTDETNNRLSTDAQNYVNNSLAAQNLSKLKTLLKEVKTDLSSI